MPVPNVSAVAFVDQADLDSQDLEILADASADTGVVTLSAVTSTGAANGSVSVAAGDVKINLLLVHVTLTTVAIPANSSGFVRYDAIVCDATGIPSRVAGTAQAIPEFPVIAAGTVALAVVRVPNGHTTGTVIPANTIIDKRIFVTLNPYRTVTGTDASMASEFVIRQTDSAKSTLNVQGANVALNNNTLQQWSDYLGAPIAWMAMVGGFAVNDDICTAYSTSGPKPFLADIYGYMRQGTQTSYAFGGPPGNLLDFESACHEQYNASRLPSLGLWGPVSGCTIANFTFSLPPVSPTTYRRGIRVTSTTANPWVSMPSGASALSGVVAGDVVSVVFNVRSSTAAAARNWNAKLDFYTAAGAAVGSTVNGSVISVPNSGAWTAITVNGAVVPATATRIQAGVIGTVTSGEIFDICGIAILKDQQLGVFGPPFVGSNPTQSDRTASGAAVGDRWKRLDTAGIPGQREYICTVGGVPTLQRWVPLDTSTVYRMQADQVNSTVTQAAIPPLQFAVDANGMYQFEYTLWITSALVTTGWQFGLTGPASPTKIAAKCVYQSSATADSIATITSFTQFTLVTAAYVATPTPILVKISGLLQNGANAGTVALTFASEVAASAITVLKGSVLSVT
jgi:hypothetical protein